MKTQWAVIAALLFSLLVAVFAIVNNEPVTVNFLFGTMETSAVLIILGSAAAGALIMGLLGLFINVRVGLEKRELRKRIKELEENLEDERQNRPEIVEQEEEQEVQESPGGEESAEGDNGSTGDNMDVSEKK